MTSLTDTNGLTFTYAFDGKDGLGPVEMCASYATTTSPKPWQCLMELCMILPDRNTEFDMATPKQSTKRRQEQIARATLALVAEHGLAACNVAAVARRVGLVPSALYRHFRNKDDMLDAAVGIIQSKLLDNVQTVCARNTHAVERLHDLLQQHVRLIKQSRGIPQVIFSPDFYLNHPKRRARVFDGIRQYLAAVADMIREGQAAGTIRSGLDAETAAVLFLGLVQPSAMLWNLSSGKFNVARHAEKAWPLFVQILTTG